MIIAELLSILFKFVLDNFIITIKNNTIMQEDPRYTKMLEKSFIMSKYHQKNPKA